MDTAFENALADIVGPENCSTDEPMSAHTTFRVGGPADYFVSPSNQEEVRQVAALCRDTGMPLYTMGCGSNLLVADGGLRAVVMRIGARFAEVIVHSDGSVSAQAGATNAKVARAALDASLSGFEFAATLFVQFCPMAPFLTW